MKGISFFDTNILVYADDDRSPDKQAVAISLFRECLSHGSAAVSLQVLQEYYAVVTRKLGVVPEHAQQKVGLLSLARVICFEARDVIAAIELHRLQQISFWDAMIVHAARLSGAGVLYTEDLQHGSTIAGVRIVNPFL
ncbi:MAG: PIN domain-containing protein [Candidatus Solibacter sp.]